MRDYNCFSGDNNKVLISAQYDFYEYLIYDIFDVARKLWLLCAEIVMLESEDVQRVKDKTSFDHRTLQQVHDAIATAFRYIHRDHQLEIGFNKKSPQEINHYFDHSYNDWDPKKFNDMELQYLYKWNPFFKKHLKELTTIDSNNFTYNKNHTFVRDIITASIFYPHKDKGYEAEKRCDSYIYEYFGNGLPEAVEKHWEDFRIKQQKINNKSQ